MQKCGFQLLSPFSTRPLLQAWLLPIILSVILIFVSFHNFLLFHAIAELFAVVVGILLCVVV